MKSLSFEKLSDGQSDMNITIKYIFLFLQIIIRSQKKLMRDLEIKVYIGVFW